jgi:hypothetical protein
LFITGTTACSLRVSGEKFIPSKIIINLKVNATSTRRHLTESEAKAKKKQKQAGKEEKLILEVK